MSEFERHTEEDCGRERERERERESGCTTHRCVDKSTLFHSAPKNEFIDVFRLCWLKHRKVLGGSPGLVVMGDDSYLRACGFKSQ